MNFILGAVRTTKIGFKASAVMKAASRGKVHDPNKIVSLEIAVVVADVAEFESRALRQEILKVSARYAPSLNRVTRVGRPVNISMGAKAPVGFRQWFEVS